MELKFDKKIPEEMVSVIRPFVEKFISRYDTSKLKDIRFVYTKNGSRGFCEYPCRRRGTKAYRITVYVGLHESWEIQFVKSWNRDPVPIWDGSGNKTMVPSWQPGEVDRERAASKVEIAAYIFGHEMYHFLRRSRQIPGQNTQNQADGFGIKTLREFRSS